MRTLTGVPLSPGYAEGPVFVFRPDAIAEPPRATITSADVAAELRLFKASLQQTRVDLEMVQDRLAGNIDNVSASHIFHAHLLLLADPAWSGEIEERIAKDHLSASTALHDVTSEWEKRFAKMANAYLAERAIDLRDVSRRVLLHIQPQIALPIANLSEPSIIAARSMLPSDMVHLDRSKTLGIVTEEGGVADHVAIVTRSMGIPGLTGVRALLDKVKDGERAILDGQEGLLLVGVSKTTLRRYHALARKREADQRALAAFRDEPGATSDGHRVGLWANIGDVDDAKMAREMGAEAIGLFRTELAFLTSQRHPTEAQQLSRYMAMAKATGGMPLTIRTLDLGGDKMLHYDTERGVEANPLLGRRGIRRSLAEPKVFRRQLRALLRLAVDYDVRILLPMVVSVSDIVQSREQIAIAAGELHRAGVAHRSDVPLGAMVETPSAVITIEDLLPHVDFISVGTNDLIQYLLVADRTDGRIREHYTFFHRAVLRALDQVARACIEAGKPLCLCGELAGFGNMTGLILGLGYSTLSMAPSEIPVVKRHLKSMKMADAKALADQTLRLSLRRHLPAGVKSPPQT